MRNDIMEDAIHKMEGGGGGWLVVEVEEGGGIKIIGKEKVVS
jgi:hypothetical protein